MSYPPPNQPGRGQQPGPYGQQPGGQYPPGDAQSGPYGQPQQPGGQYPPSGPQPGGQYPQGSGQPGFPPPPGFEVQPTQQKRTGLIVGIAAAAVLVIGGAAVGAFALFSGNNGASTATSPPGKSDDAGSGEPQATPEQTVQEYVGLAETTMRSKGSGFDQAKATEILCPDFRKLQEKQKNDLITQQSKHPDPKDPYWAGLDTIEFRPSNIRVNGDSGTFDMALLAQGKSQQSGTLTLTKASGHWQVCGPPPK